MSRDTILHWANLLAMLGALTVNILSNALPLNGLNTGQISDRFDVFFVPAGYVFSIWGLIYIGWIAFIIWQFRPANRSSPRLRALGYWFALSCVFNAAWLFCWHYQQFGLSVVVMLALLATLILSYLRLDVGLTRVGAAERWSVDIPFGVYLGWVSVATIANITDYLYYIQWDGFGIAPQVWAVIMLAVASLLGLAMAPPAPRRRLSVCLCLGLQRHRASNMLLPLLVADAAWAATGTRPGAGRDSASCGAARSAA